MPSKPDKYGMKIFWACDAATNYPLRGSPYLGKEFSSARPAERNLSIAANVVYTLTSDFQGTGRNVTCDNYFTDLKLAESLAKTKLTVVGTVKRNKTFLPREFQEKNAFL
ncbi:PiggyBac transposable element-derived protein 4 [Elysia marginata]|uniref:PiggyBac transposable element-derived protein 4 n=1 Tax=Elysia marginata TaxID=1093978 RepID=A0AAV4HMY9_9GAST|nr:PiggyBac transposable element-derived protein 4 [Elysia marginata]